MTEKELHAYQKKELRQSGEPTKEARFFVPHVDIYETKESVILLAEMPGVDKEHVDIDIEDRTLTITGQIPEEERKGQSCLLREYETGNFVRSFTISENIDQNGIEAVIANGILSVTLPKAEPAHPRKITVQPG